ncbi:uncharacterized protein LOC143922572 isoform X2 [Arctopsyche grandis]|uniref:uncharacterized protein LOC143922572 isoform X2 n=1 Tax=Arctopsyche grandis TaxID=121162 RepID=UPI00406D8E2A
MQQAGLRRWTSEGGTPRRTPLRPSREGSAPSVSLDVRCGCQFYQSDALLPDRQHRPALPASRQAVARPTSDHEYEPIGKPISEKALGASEPPKPPEPMVPPAPSTTPPPPSVFVSEPELAPKADDDASSTTSHERHMLRPSTEDDHTNMEFEGDDTEPPSSSMALQKQLEDRYFVNTPTTTESRTDCEVSTSQVESSALENLPLKRENRKRSMVGEEASKLHQKLKTQTGRLKTKLKTIKKPQFNMPERPKFNMPERPKFNMPERPKFNMPERPKFNMPERPKFNFPDRPKFNLPDRPKFNMPERPKINLPERPKFRMPDRPKFLEKTKFTLPDRPKFTMPDKSKFKLPDRPKINFSAAFSRNKENTTKEKTDQSTDSTSGSKKRMIDFDFRTYPRFSRFKKDKKGGKSTKTERPGTPPPGFATVPRVTKDRQAVMSTSHWEDMSSNMSSEEPRHYGLPKDYPTDKDNDFESKLAQVDKDYNQMQEEYQREKLTGVEKVKLENAELWNAMERSSAQRLEHRGSLPFYITGNEQNNEEFGNTIENDDESSAASTGHHRRGVLEEIDNDEFFLRQKGISQDNIEVGKYLSDEIRDAFRSPVNALNQLDGVTDRNNMYDQNQNEESFDDNIDQTELNEEVDHSHEIDHDDGYYTFPPVRPSRSRKQKVLENKDQENDSSFSEGQNIPAPAMFQEPPVVKQEVEKSEAPRKSLFSGNNFKEPEMLQNLNEYENEMEQTRDIPTIPKRRKKTSNKDFNYSENGSLFNEPYEDDKWMKPTDQNDRMIDDEIIVHRMEYVMPNMESDLPEESPVAPRRMRSRSRGSRATSACDDDRTSRGADSLTLDSHNHLPTVDIEWNLDDGPDDPGYAIVDKVVSQKKNEPPPRPPAPVRRNRSLKSLSSDRQFFTVPRAIKESTPPKRPSRNYSTLGPSRPPRKKSTTSLTDLKSIPQETSNSDTTQYVEIDDEEFDPHKGLKSGEVISKMKDRPLPPPPRPPRGPKRSKDPSDRRDDDMNFEDLTVEVEMPLNNGSLEDFNDRVPNEDFDYRVPIEDFNDNILTHDYNMKEYDRRAPIDDYDQEEIIEIEVSTQTDPLPDDFDYTIGMEEPFIDNDKIITTPQNEFQTDDIDVEENSIDAEILYRGLQRFRESSRPSSRTSRPITPAERPKTPIDRPKTPLDRMSPTAILVERRVSSPTRINERNVMVTEASLIVMPIDDPDSYESKTISSQKPIHPDSYESKTISSQKYPIHPEPVPKEKPSEMWEALNAQYPVLPSMDVENRISECAIERQIVPESYQQQRVQEPSQQQIVLEPSHQQIVLEPSHQQIVLEPPQQQRVLEPSLQQRVLEAPQQQIELEALQQEIVQEPPPREIIRDVPPQQVVPEAPKQQMVLPSPELEVVKTQRMQVSDLDVERLNVAELQASRILVSEIEGLSLQVTDINSKSGNIIVRGIELAPGIFDEILQKFAQMAPPSAPMSTQTPAETQTKSDVTQETQTDSVAEAPQRAPEIPPPPAPESVCTLKSLPPVSAPQPQPPPAVFTPEPPPPPANLPEPQTPSNPPEPQVPSNIQQPFAIPAAAQEVIFELGPNVEFYGEAPERPPLPHLPPNVYPLAYYPEYSIPPNSFYRLRSPPDRPPPDFSEGDPPLPSSRRRKHKREVVSSSDEEYRPAPRRAPARSTEPSVAELSSQLFRACQNSVGRTARYIMSYITSQFGSGENKKDMQMALVIVLVMIAGLILIGVGDGRTVHHHHWDFFNPPTNDN